MSLRASRSPPAKLAAMVSASRWASSKSEKLRSTRPVGVTHGTAQFPAVPLFHAVDLRDRMAADGDREIRADRNLLHDVPAP